MVTSTAPSPGTNKTTDLQVRNILEYGFLPGSSAHNSTNSSNISYCFVKTAFPSVISL